MNNTEKKLLSDVLDIIEQKETGLLVWGIVDGMFTEYELSDLINPLIDDAIENGLHPINLVDTDAKVIAELVNLKWIVKVRCANNAEGYRSRMSETVRLMQRLRQLFPKHVVNPNGWQEAPTLVADFRFQRRQRFYPRRNLIVDDVVNTLSKSIKNESIIGGVKAILTPIDSNDTKILLSGFQVRATVRILNAIENEESLATIVCAGTGSGKTLAFYLPALSSIIRHSSNNQSPWVKTVGIYPRNELLKDQLREVISRTCHIGSVLKKNSIRVGALYGGTPKSARSLPKTKSWFRIGNDYKCPSLKCIRCNSSMIWLHQDHSHGHERLVCQNQNCDWSIDGTVFPLTRESLAQNPPDILLTTTEMLNQRLSDNDLNHLFGVGTAHKPPELVLLDEVHTYEGRHGAQVAYLMRRWMHLVEQPLRFVGLSATLREATAFFSDLTGIFQSNVEEISPKVEEIETEGAEYMIALRGDPVSRAALLSCTIQTTLLLERCLDPNIFNNNDSISHGFFGRRTFVFTDDLDVNNRLYFGLLDAEGRNSNKTINSNKRALASLRNNGASFSRYQGGQDWSMCEELGQDLNNRKLRVIRVSSQDPGVDDDADIVVATASLEVGFDDPLVGAVIQHKAPRGMAGFLQRKGRAGRSRGMRPWTAVVLSDYGRDRIAYQGYDLLFDPELSPRTLPLSNRYISKMQAVFATIDYLGKKLEHANKGSVWTDLSKPPGSGVRKKQLIKELRMIMDAPNAFAQFRFFLKNALKIKDDELSALLWEFPRPLMTMVLPTALRRLSSDWNAYGTTGADIIVKNNPLPDFIPATLFADLNLAEVTIELSNNDRDINNVMPIFNALREFAPGRVSRRFGIHYLRESYWIAPSDEALHGLLPYSKLKIDDFGDFLSVGTYSYLLNNKKIDIPVFKPLILRPTLPNNNIKDSSQSRLKWHSQFVPLGKPIWLEPPVASVWSNLIPQIGFFTHAYQAPVEIRRFTVGANAEVGIDQYGTKVLLDIDFTDNDETPVALGTAFAGDGVVFQINIPVDLCNNPDDSSGKWRALRTIRYFDSAWIGQSLASVPSPFLRKWLAEVFLSAVTYEAIQSTSDFKTAATSVINGSSIIKLSDVLEMLFQSQVFSDVQLEGETELSAPDKLRTDLDSLLKQQDIQSALIDLGGFLWNPITSEWESWLRKIYQCTLGAALLKTIGDLCPAINTDELSIDFNRGPLINEGFAPLDDKSLEVWITEKNPGGNGLIEDFMRAYSEDPRRFFSMVRASTEMGEFELIDHQLIQLFDLFKTNTSESKCVIDRIRMINNHKDLIIENRKLRIALLEDGFSPFHGFMVSIANRILRAGSNLATDNYISKTINQWKTEEERLGLEIDLRVICYWLSQSDDIDNVVDVTGIPNGPARIAWRMSAIYGLLWGRGREIRQTSLQVRNMFTELPPVERLIVIDSLVDDRVKIPVNSDNQWLEEASKHLTNGQLVTLTCSTSERSYLGSALHALITNPIDSGYILAYARLQGIRQTNESLEADIELLESIQ